MVSIMQSNARSEAKGIIKELVQKINQARPSSLQPKPYLYKKYVPDKFDYNPDGTVSNVSWKEEFVTDSSSSELLEWSWKYIEQEVQARTAVEKLAEMFQKPPDFVKNAFRSFLGGKQFSFENDVEILLDDLEGRKPSWHVEAKVYGIVPSEDSFTIASGIKLRKVLPQDLVFYESAFSRRDLLSPHSILEVSIIGYPGEMQDRVEVISIVMALFRETPAIVASYRMRPRSFVHFGGEYSKNRQFSNDPLVSINEEDVRNFSEFLELMQSRIPKAVLCNQPVDPLEMGIQRYLDSLRSQVLPEEKLMYAIMALEALFLENETELRFRLSARLSKLLGYLNEKPETVLVDTSQAYDLRSAHVHGASLTSEERIRCQDVLKRIWRYVRKTLIFYILNDVTSDGKKRQFLKQLDLALVDEEKSQIIKQLSQGATFQAREALK